MHLPHPLKDGLKIQMRLVLSLNRGDEQGNIWYFVETACEGDFKICGWISEKDLEHVDVGP